MKKQNGNFESRHGDIETYVVGDVGVFHAHKSILDVAGDLAKVEDFFAKIDVARTSPQIKVLLLTSDASVFGEEQTVRFWESVVKMREERKFSEEFASDARTLTAREENAGAELIRRIYHFDKIVVAVLRGSIAGEFLGTALATDYRIASKDLKISFPHLRLGMPPRGGLAYFLPRYVGDATAKRILLEGEPIAAERARELNLIDEVLGDEDFESKCIEIAKKLADLPADVVAMTKRLFAKTLTGLEESLQEEQQLFEFGSFTPPPGPTPE